ncbi:MAG: penicillin-binding protein [Omnitrophica WOR_2 bacterium]|jgi:cell division protein FtsI (penicillin-binding protein 3)
MSSIKSDILRNVYIVYIIVALCGLAIIGKASYIQFIEGDMWREKGKIMNLKVEKIEAIRGNIMASDGSLLAASVPLFNLRIDAGNTHYNDKFFYENVDSLALCLSNLFNDKSKSKYKQILTNGRKTNNRYLLLKRDITFAQLKKVRRFPIFRLGKYKGGIIAETRSKRVLPYQWLAFRTIGWDKDGTENDIGLEGAYSDILKGESGSRMMQRIGSGAWRPTNEEMEIDPQDGHDIITSIDVNIQDVAEDALMRQLIENEADHGCAVLMEVNTGFIVAIANLGKNKEGLYEEKFNYAAGESSEPGSTFKLASVLAALDEGLIDLNDTVNTENGTTRFANRTMRDSHKGGYGRISVARAFELSSNVGISKVITKAYKKNPQKLIDKFYFMQLNKPLGLEIPGEGKPNIKDTENKYWSKVSLPWMSIGYEIALTPMQTLAFYNAIANNGTLVKPQFVKEIRHAGLVTKTFEPVILKDKIVTNQSTIDQAKKLLEGVVQKGTATNLRNSVFKIAGKTGTAQIAQNNKGYNKSNYKASFVGYFPADNPKYSCIVVINNPTKGVYYGGSIAGPVFKEIADKVYATRLMPDSLTNDTVHHDDIHLTSGSYQDLAWLLKYSKIKFEQSSDSDYISINTEDSVTSVKPIKLSADRMPEVIGMGAKDAIYLLESSGIRVKVLGKGKVKRQSILPGMAIKKGESCIIELG